MLEFLGLSQIEDVFADIPEAVLFNRLYDLPKEMSELEIKRHLQALANKNTSLDTVLCFLGAGAYHHYIPSVVDAIISRSEFATAYTPYQPEISQGVLQAIFEYQTLICELTGMDVSNASMYDGPTAFAEAAMMACSATRRSKVLVSRAVHPEYRGVLATYAKGQNVAVAELPYKDGMTDVQALSASVTEEIAAVMVSYPNFFGSIEDLKALAEIAHAKKAQLIVACNPLALGILESPGACGADIVVGDGQPLGNSLSFGGPYVGFLAATKEHVRRVPGRIAGQTKDSEGRRGFVLTLQAREQHIRREKASSNICSNQALNALAATVYMSYMGKQGLQDVANLNIQKANYAKKRLSEVAGVELVFSAYTFNEFAVRLQKPVADVNKQLLQKGIIGGYELERNYPELANCMLIAVTEQLTKDDIDVFAARLGEIV
ncbi:aminomethyl-transferring glycine dehydrogenase subunit GcvPA [Fodinisporobacter ferrooxydans]|uniref:Probable glycine dehydrogenase (decarboxylating) subunit 1 n=2 Tax=Fodinisporobacter ferrooxydans TaxID=2901836 RepID=A0ABY4CR15_9BACL|nr:aminomethyl-transferring glycine dehydrogenase subunit GcvPA [Alicyclobacillaceae bacterium MYW30-H2]